MKIMVFLHGTTIMHKAGLGKTPQERVRQVEENEPSVHRYEEYVPVGKANEKVNKWKDQGAEIIYLSSHMDGGSVKKDIQVLSKYNFPDGPVLYRHLLESYAKVAEKAMPDILIEDDCESIGGESQMTYPHINPNKKKLIKSIIVKEFSGIDNLPENLEDLIGFRSL